MRLGARRGGQAGSASVNRPIIRGLSLAAAVLLAACREERPITYGPPANIHQLAAGLPNPDDGFVLLAAAPTEGRFGCALAVAKMTPEPGSPNVPAAGDLLLAALRSNEEAYWAESLRGVGAIQRFVFLRPRSTRPDGHDTATLCDASARLGATLLLVYTPRQLGPNSAHVLGVLYNTETHEPLATVRASSRLLDDEGEEVSPGRKRGDRREEDAFYRVQREFEDHTLACLRELIHLDAPQAPEQHKWGQPFIERWWIENRNTR